MLIERMRKRLSADRASFIEPCLPSPADKPPSGFNWIHEIKHDGFRLMARRDPVGIRLITRMGNDWTQRYPLVVEAVNHLKVRSCLIDGEVECCDERGVAAFHVLRHRRNEERLPLCLVRTCGGSPSRCARRRLRASCAKPATACGSCCVSARVQDGAAHGAARRARRKLCRLLPVSSGQS